MLIDWFTVAAQALNFIVLVWLLKRFLYKPILDAIDAREKRISDELAGADAKTVEAKKESDEFKHKNEVFDQQRAALLSKATDEAKAERQRLIAEARQAADALSAKRQVSLKADVSNLTKSVSTRVQHEVFSIARKALKDLAGTALEECLTTVFVTRLKQMDGKAKADFAATLKAGSEPARVRSAFDLPAEQRLAIEAALKELVTTDVRVRFETAPDVISGIEITISGQKVAWSISNYLTSLETSVSELLGGKGKPEAKMVVKADTAKPEVRAH
jgi:F-type H+-transporting ATPase subunit b